MFGFPTEPEPIGNNRIISFFSASPGAGSTTLAAVLASELKNSCIIDLSHSRKLRSYLGMPSSDYTYSVTDLQYGTEEEISNSAVNHPKGFKVIPGPVNELDLALLDSQACLRILKRCKRVFETSIVVASPIWRAGWITAMVSDVVVYVMRPERTDLDMFHEHVELFSRLGASERLKIILNQTRKPGGLNTEEVLQAIGKVDFQIPYSDNVVRQTNRRMIPDLPGKEKLNSIL